MSLIVGCSKCGKKYKVGDDKVGKKIKCAGCGAIIAIPAPKSSAPPEGDVDLWDLPPAEDPTAEDLPPLPPPGGRKPAGKKSKKPEGMSSGVKIFLIIFSVISGITILGCGGFYLVAYLGLQKAGEVLKDGAEKMEKDAKEQAEKAKAEADKGQATGSAPKESPSSPAQSPVAVPGNNPVTKPPAAKVVVKITVEQVKDGNFPPDKKADPNVVFELRGRVQMHTASDYSGPGFLITRPEQRLDQSGPTIDAFLLDRNKSAVQVAAVGQIVTIHGKGFGSSMKDCVVVKVEPSPGP